MTENDSVLLEAPSEVVEILERHVETMASQLEKVNEEHFKELFDDTEIMGFVGQDGCVQALKSTISVIKQVSEIDDLALGLPESEQLLHIAYSATKNLTLVESRIYDVVIEGTMRAFFMCHKHSPSIKSRDRAIKLLHHAISVLSTILSDKEKAK